MTLGEAHREEGHALPQPRLHHLLPFATIATALAIGAWIAANAVYCADDYLVVGEGWAGGSLAEAIRRWWQVHFVSGIGDGWPRFYRPTWRASYVVDAHLFGCRPALSALAGWAMHCATAMCVGRLCRRATGSPGWAWLATWLCLLPGAAAQGALWVSARGSLMATWFTLSAIAAATATAPLRWWRIGGIVVLVLLAATSNEVGMAAAPLVAFTALLHHARGTPGRPGVCLALLVATLALLCWRRAMLGCWVGGYAPLDNLAPAWHGLLPTVLSGTGAVALFGQWPVPAVCTIGLGALALAALAAFCLRGGPSQHRAMVWVALGLLVLFLVPFAGSTFRTPTDTNGRSIYAAHAAWSLALPVALHAVAGSPFRRCAIAFVLVGGAAIGFAGTLAAWHRALGTARALFAAVDELPLQDGNVLLNVPDRDGPILIARNATTTALQPPFRAKGVAVAHATDLDMVEGALTSMAVALAHLPAVSAWHWDDEAQRFAAGWWPTTVHWRGALATDDDGSLRCGGLPVLDPPPGLATLAPGTWIELQGELAGDPGRPGLRALASRGWQPMLQRVGERNWRFQGRAGDWFFLLVGSEPCCVGFGAAGALGIAHPLVLPIQVADALGGVSFELPAAAANATRLQAFVMRQANVVQLGELHVRE